MKNDGDEPTSLPWVDHPVEPRQMSEEAERKTFGYEVATIGFFPGPPHRKNPELTLDAKVGLRAQPGNEGQHIRLRPGEWVEIESRVKVICSQADFNTCLRHIHEVKLQISAWWYQRQLTTTIQNDCIFQNGAYTQNEIDSKTVAVANLHQIPQSDQKD